TLLLQPLIERGAFAFLLCRTERLFDHAFERVERGAARLALVRRERAERLQKRGELAVAAENADTQLLERIGIACRRDLAQPVLTNRVEIFHRGPQACDSAACAWATIA